MGFNARYLLDALKHAASEVVLTFSGYLDPVSIRTVAGSNEDVAVVMPMRV